MKPRPLFFLAALMCASPMAMSAPASQQEAERLESILKTYLGEASDALTVTANGEHYDVKLDLLQQMKKAEPASQTTMTPLFIKLQDQGGGKWLATEGASFSFDTKEINDSKETQASGNIGAFTISGTFDRTLGAFSDAKALISDVSLAFKEQGATSNLNGFNIIAKKVSIDLNSGLASPLAERANARLYIEFNDISGDIDIPPDEKVPMGVKGSFSLAHTDRTLEFKGTRPKSLMKLVDWAKAHPDEKAQEAGRADLAKILKENLPVFETASFGSTLKGLSVDTPFGKAGLENVTADLSMNGAVPEGKGRLVVTISGLTLPTGIPQEILPKLAIELMPQFISLDIVVTGYDLAAPAAMLLDHLEKTAEEPSPEMEKLLLAALLPKGDVNITLAPGVYKSPALTVDYQGSMVAGPERVPFGQTLIKAKGLDQVVELLKAAPPELGLENGIYGILAAKGFGKQDADGAVSWHVETTREGMVTVNGVKIPGIGNDAN